MQHRWAFALRNAGNWYFKSSLIDTAVWGAELCKCLIQFNQSDVGWTQAWLAGKYKEKSMEEGCICAGADEAIPLSVKMMSPSSRSIFGLLPRWAGGESFCLGGPSIWMSDVFLSKGASLRGSHAGFYIQLSSLTECKWVDFKPCPGYSCCLGREHQLCGPACAPHSVFFSPLLSSSTHCFNSVLLDFKPCTCHLNVKKTEALFQPLLTTQEGVVKRERVKICCSDVMRSRCSIEPEVVLLSLSLIQQPQWKCLIY